MQLQLDDIDVATLTARPLAAPTNDLAECLEQLGDEKAVAMLGQIVLTAPTDEVTRTLIARLAIGDTSDTDAG